MDFGEDLSRGSPLSLIAKLMTAAQQQNLPIEDDSSIELGTVSPLEDIHDLDIISGLADAEVETPDSHIQELPYRRNVAESPYPYDLVHTTVGIGFTFPKTGKKHAGRISDNADTHIKVDHDSWLDMGIESFGLAFWIFKTSAGLYGIITKRDIANTTNAGVEVYIEGTTIHLRISDGTNTVLLSGSLATLNDGNPHSVILNIPASGNLELFIDIIPKGTIPRGSVANINNTRDVIICARDNNGTIQDRLSGDLAWLVWKKSEIFDSAQRDDFHNNGFLDLTNSADVEVLTIPGMMNEDPMPNSTPSLFSAGS